MSDTSTIRPNQLLTFLVATAGCVLIFTTTERCFEKADVRNAITMVKTLQSGAGTKRIPDALIAKHPDAQAHAIIWSGERTNSMYGFVRVRAAVPGSGSVHEYLFDVNLAGQRLHPANEKARTLFETLRSKQQPQPSANPETQAPTAP